MGDLDIIGVPGAEIIGATFITNISGLDASRVLFNPDIAFEDPGVAFDFQGMIVSAGSFLEVSFATNIPVLRLLVEGI